MSFKRIECLAASGLALANWKHESEFNPDDSIDKMISGVEEILDVLFEHESGDGFNVNRVLMALGKIGSESTKSREFWLSSK